MYVLGKQLDSPGTVERRAGKLNAMPGKQKAASIEQLGNGDGFI